MQHSNLPIIVDIQQKKMLASFSPAFVQSPVLTTHQRISEQRLVIFESSDAIPDSATLQTTADTRPPTNPESRMTLSSHS